MPRVVKARGADADAGRVERRALVEGDHVLVDGDAGLVERFLRDLAGQPLRRDIDEQQMIVGAAGDDAEAEPLQFLGERPGVGDVWAA